jgi:hypothetical protein
VSLQCVRYVRETNTTHFVRRERIVMLRVDATDPVTSIGAVRSLRRSSRGCAPGAVRRCKRDALDAGVGRVRPTHLTETESEQELAEIPEDDVDLLVVLAEPGSIEVIKLFELDPIELSPPIEVRNERREVALYRRLRWTEPEDESITGGFRARGCGLPSRVPSRDSRRSTSRGRVRCPRPVRFHAVPSLVRTNNVHEE